MFRPFALLLLIACDLTTSKPTDDTGPVEAGVCVSDPMETDICAGRPTDMVISSPEEAMDAIWHAAFLVELQTFGAMVEDVALQILAEQDAGLREICLEASDDPETGTRIYEGDCAGSETESAFVGRAEYSETDEASAATFTGLSAIDVGSGATLEADGTYTDSSWDDLLIFDADLSLSYDLGYPEPVAYTLVTEGFGAGLMWHQVAWMQLDSDPDLTVRGAICFVADWEASEICDDEPDGTLTLVGAQRWDLVSDGSRPCDDCTEVYVDCEAQEDWCPEAAE